VRREPVVLAVSLFESSEIALQPIRGADSTRLSQVMKHVVDGMDDQAASSFQVAEHAPLLGLDRDLPPVALLPSDQGVDPSVAIGAGADGRELLEQPPQTSGIGAFGTLPAPRQPLALDMHEAALTNRVGPTLLHRPQQARLSVGGDAQRRQPLPSEAGTERPHLRRRLVHSQAPSQDPVGLRIHHHGQGPASSAQIRCVDADMLAACQIDPALGRAIQPVLDDAPQPDDGTATLATQLAIAVSFGDPTLEPRPLTLTTQRKTASQRRVTAVPTQPSLLATMRVPVTTGPCTATEIAPLFVPCLNRLSYNHSKMMPNT